MYHQIYLQCRRALLQKAINKFLNEFATTNNFWNLEKTISSSTCMFIHDTVSIRCLVTSASKASASNTISENNILRSHLPDIIIPENVPFHQYMFEKCDQFKDLPALKEFLTGKSYSYSQLKESSIRVAGALHRLGYRKGDVLLSFSPNNIDISILMLACASLGVWYSAANPTFTADELSRQLTDSGSLAVFTIPQLAETVKKALSNKNFPHRVKQVFVFGSSPGLQPFQSLMDEDLKSFPDVDINPMEDVFILPYSSGTTGLPKGVMLTHHNILANCLQIEQSVGVNLGERSLGLLPFYHIFGMVVVQYVPLQAGALLVTLPKFDPEIFLRCIQETKINLANLVPSLVGFLAKHTIVAKYDITSIRKIFSAAAPLGAGLTNEFLHRHTHGVTLQQGYGLTETSPVTNIDTTNTGQGSVGTLVVNTVGKIIDLETNTLLGPRQVGEYCVRGPQVMKGYFNNKEATNNIIKPGGWLHTGDIGYFTEDGLVIIKDRMKELIKYKGSQVPPAELEALLLEHKDVADAAVIGVPDEVAGELPRAFVVRKPGVKVTEKDILDFVKGKMAPSKRLHGGVEFVEEVPRNASGKILRREIKDKFLKRSHD